MYMLSCWLDGGVVVFYLVFIKSVEYNEHAVGYRCSTVGRD